MGDTKFNLTIDDTSPMFLWYPWGEGGLGRGSVGQGWTTYYDGTGYDVNGVLPRGSLPKNPAATSYHVTALDGASVTIQFHGTAIYLSGIANRSYSVVLDNTPGADVVPNDYLVALSDLRNADHTLTITADVADDSALLMIDKAVVTLSLQGTNNTLFTIKNDDPLLTYNGPWTIQSDGFPSPSRITSQLGASASLGFRGQTVAVYSGKDFGHDLYNITLDGFTTTLNGSSYWKVGDTLRYFASGLDPTQPHQITMTNAVSGANLSLNRIEVWNTTSPDQSSPSPSGHVPGSGTGGGNGDLHLGAILIGTFCGLAVVALVGFIIWRRKRSKKPRAYFYGTNESYEGARPYADNSQSPGLVAGARMGQIIPQVGGVMTSGTEQPPSHELGTGSTSNPQAERNSTGGGKAIPALFLVGPEASGSPELSPNSPRASTSRDKQLPSLPHDPERPQPSLEPYDQPPSPLQSYERPPLSPPPLSPPPNRSPQFPLQPSSADLDRIVELVAQRIDRGPVSSESSPPHYYPEGN